MIILIILCIHIGSVLIIFLSIDLANELQLKVTQKTVSFGFSLILSIWVEYLLVIFYFAVYFIFHYTNNDYAKYSYFYGYNDDIDGDDIHDINNEYLDFGKYNFILLSIPGSIPWVMIIFANYRRDNIYHHMVFTEIFENYNHSIPINSIQKISDILVRNGIGTSIIPIPVKTEQIVDKLFAVIYLFGYDETENNDDQYQQQIEPQKVDNNNDKIDAVAKKEENNMKKMANLNKQYQYLQIKRQENKINFIKNMMKRYIKQNAIKIGLFYNLIFYHENIALFLSICFGISRFISCILMPIVWFIIFKNMNINNDENNISLNIVQNWIIYIVLGLYALSFIPFTYNMYCIFNCQYYFFLITPIKSNTNKNILRNDKNNRIQYKAAKLKEQQNKHLLPHFIENTMLRNKAIWDVIEDKNIAGIIIQYLPNAKQQIHFKEMNLQN